MQEVKGANVFHKLAARVVKTNIPGRAAALERERMNTQRLYDMGNKLYKHKRPIPTVR